MADNPKDIGMQDESPKSPESWLSFFPKFELRLPFPWLESKPEFMVKDDKKAAVAMVDQGEEGITEKPDFVTLPKTDLFVPPLETEADVSGKTSNPAVLWQVYALGGFLILSWAWARWKERKARKRSDDEEDDKDSGDI